MRPRSPFRQLNDPELLWLGRSSLGKKDFLLKIKTSRKDAKESAYWLRLIDADQNPEHAFTSGGERADEYLRRDLPQKGVRRRGSGRQKRSWR
jgi:hypothetical protein